MLSHESMLNKAVVPNDTIETTEETINPDEFKRRHIQEK
jgi:hypothetical protein